MSIHQNGIYEIPTPLIEGFISVLEKKGKKFSFFSKSEAKIEKFEYNIIRWSVSDKKKDLC